MFGARHWVQTERFGCPIIENTTRSVLRELATQKVAVEHTAHYARSIARVQGGRPHARHAFRLESHSVSAGAQMPAPGAAVGLATHKSPAMQAP